MKVKINTKEKFHVIILNEAIMSVNMTAELHSICIPYLKSPIRNIIVSFQEVLIIEETAAQELLKLQQLFYENDSSFVICHLNSSVEKILDINGLLELMNITPTESEAWDIVQMEEVEREFLREDDINNKN